MYWIGVIAVVWLVMNYISYSLLFRGVKKLVFRVDLTPEKQIAALRALLD
jgi:hypothetical protein